MSARVTAIVLSYNGRTLLELILPTLAAQTFADFDCVVVDNGSSDGTTEWLHECWPDVEVVSLPENIGIAAALNRGIASARGEFIALLNNDLELEPDWLAELVAVLERNHRLGAVACKLLSYHDRSRLYAAGDGFSHRCVAYCRGYGELDRGQFDRTEEVFATTGGAALYRAQALADVGPFDESFFAYFEDADWGLRAQLAGYRTVYVPTAVGYHIGGATTRGMQDPFYYGLQRRNAVALIVKNLPLSFVAANAHHILLTQVGGLYTSARQRLLTIHLRALTDAIRLLPRWLRERRRIQRSRLVGAARLREMIADDERA